MSLYEDWLKRVDDMIGDEISRANELEWEDTYDFIDSFLTTED